jgi:hypothetical protein
MRVGLDLSTGRLASAGAGAPESLLALVVPLESLLAIVATLGSLLALAATLKSPMALAATSGSVLAATSGSVLAVTPETPLARAATRVCPFALAARPWRDLQPDGRRRPSIRCSGRAVRTGSASSPSSCVKSK